MIYKSHKKKGCKVAMIILWIIALTLILVCSVASMSAMGALILWFRSRCCLRLMMGRIIKVLLIVREALVCCMMFWMGLLKTMECWWNFGMAIRMTAWACSQKVVCLRSSLPNSGSSSSCQECPNKSITY